MIGPFPQGHFRQWSTETAWERCVVRGQRYRVIKSFTDFDGAVHPVGEEWYFVGSAFLPYDDGLSLFVADPAGNEWHIRLCWRPSDQAHVCESFHEYITSVDKGRPSETI